MPRRDNRAGRPVPPLTHARNLLLAALPSDERRVVAVHCRIVFLGKHETLFLSAGWHEAWFPLTGLVALQHPDAGGSTMTIDVIGRRGMVGLWVFLADAAAPYDGIALTDVVACAIGRSGLRAVAEATRMPAVLMRYAQAQLEERAQLMHCGRAHPLRQRVARFLGTCAAHAGTHRLDLTHEDIAEGVGAHRPAVTEALHRLGAEGVIAMERGSIVIGEASRLEATACECHTALQEIGARLQAGLDGLAEHDRGR
jgi:CRP-like cAMP-binding protein